MSSGKSQCPGQGGEGKSSEGRPNWLCLTAERSPPGLIARTRGSALRRWALVYGPRKKGPICSRDQVRASDSPRTGPRGSGTHHKMLRHVSDTCQLSPSGTWLLSMKDQGDEGRSPKCEGQWKLTQRGLRRPTGDDPAMSQTSPKVLWEVMRAAGLSLETAFPRREGKQLQCRPALPHTLPLTSPYSYEDCLFSQDGPSRHVGGRRKGRPSKIPGIVSLLFLWLPLKDCKRTL